MDIVAPLSRCHADRVLPSDTLHSLSLCAHVVCGTEPETASRAHREPPAPAPPETQSVTRQTPPAPDPP
jgi:hypothetical protein